MAEGGRLIRCGRREGTRYRNRAERANWTAWCRLVMNRGKGKEMMSPENIHLLYYHDKLAFTSFLKGMEERGRGSTIEIANENVCHNTASNAILSA